MFPAPRRRPSRAPRLPLLFACLLALLVFAFAGAATALAASGGRGSERGRAVVGQNVQPGHQGQSHAGPVAVPRQTPTPVPARIHSNPPGGAASHPSPHPSGPPAPLAEPPSLALTPAASRVVVESASGCGAGPCLTVRFAAVYAYPKAPREGACARSLSLTWDGVPIGTAEVKVDNRACAGSIEPVAVRRAPGNAALRSGPHRVCATARGDDGAAHLACSTFTILAAPAVVPASTRQTSPVTVPANVSATATPVPIPTGAPGTTAGPTSTPIPATSATPGASAAPTATPSGVASPAPLPASAPSGAAANPTAPAPIAYVAPSPGASAATAVPAAPAKPAPTPAASRPAAPVAAATPRATQPAGAAPVAAASSSAEPGLDAAKAYVANQPVVGTLLILFVGLFAATIGYVAAAARRPPRW